MTGAQSRKIHTEPEWAWSLTDQAHALGIPVFMKEDLISIIGDKNMIQEIPEEFNKVFGKGGSSSIGGRDEPID